MQEEMSASEQLVALMTRLQDLELWRPRLAGKQLSMSQFALLARLWLEPGLRVQDLSRRLGVTTPTVSVAVRKLEAEGWLQRKTDPQDKRSCLLHLSAKGQLLASKITKRRESSIREFMDGLSANEQDQLLSLLEKAITKLEKKRTSRQNKLT